MIGKTSNNKKWFLFHVLTIVISIIWLIAISARPNHIPQKKLYYSETNVCFRNQHQLSDAINNYNIDHSEMLETALPGRDFEQINKLLLDKQYLKSHFDLADKDCSYGFINMTKEGTVFCKKHGSYDSSFGTSKIPAYDNSLEIPFSSTYYDIREEKYQATRKKLEDEIRTNNINDFITGPILPSLLLLFTVPFAVYSQVTSVKKGINE